MPATTVSFGASHTRAIDSRFSILQDEMARDLAAKLGLRLTGEEEQRLTRRHTQDPEAYLLYSRGRITN